MKRDLTIIYLTASEMPAHWIDYQTSHLLVAAAGAPIVSVSRKPLDLGTNLKDDGPRGVWNIYMQMLRAASIARTPYVAVAEDDTLYTREHFWSFRPPLDQVTYDRSRWSLFSWDPIFCLRQRVSNCSLVAPRDLLVRALEERKAKWPDGAPAKLVGEVGRDNVDRRLRVSPVGYCEWYSRGPIVQLNHPTGSDSGDYGRTADGRRLVKRHGQITAIEIPHWGRGVDIVKHYEGTI